MNYQKIYNQIIERGKIRKLDCYKEKHHIIPKCMGGSNKKNNMVDLTAREHFLVHSLLCEIYPNNNKLHFAFWSMNNLKNKHHIRDYRIGARLFEYHRIKFSNYIREVNSHPKPKGFGRKISKLLKGVPKTEAHKLALRVPKSVDSWARGLQNRWDTTQIENNRNNQPTVRKVNQYALSGEFIKTWDSITETGKICSGVAHCLMGRQLTSGGFKWKYTNNNPPNKRKGGQIKK